MNGDIWEQLVVPEHLRHIIFQAYHYDLGHHRTISLINRWFFWPGIEYIRGSMHGALGGRSYLGEQLK